MVKQPASIFNDVVGPVMRGPSSSHVAAAAIIGKLIRQMVKGISNEMGLSITDTAQKIYEKINY